jgi:hypothetical protein
MYIFGNMGQSSAQHSKVTLVVSEKILWLYDT